MPLKNTFALICLTLLWTSGSPVSWANMEPIPPFMGDWEGGWVEAPKKDGNAKNNPGLVARVIGLGNDRYEIQIMEEFDKRADFKLKTEAVWKNGKMTFDQNGYSGTITADSFTGKKSRRGIRNAVFIETRSSRCTFPRSEGTCECRGPIRWVQSGCLGAAKWGGAHMAGRKWSL
jgi:hypothetical protein